MKRINITLAIVAIFILAFSVSVVFTEYKAQTNPTPFPTPIQPQTPSALVALTISESIFGNDFCSIPCWEGITPGLTTKDQALSILRTSNLIKEGSVKSRDISADPGGVSWDWEGSVMSGQDYPYLSWHEGIVDNICIYPAYRTVDEFINRFGPPEKVEVQEELAVPDLELPYYMWLYYPQRGFELLIIDIPNDAEAQLRPSDFIATIVLHPPSTFEEYMSSFGFDASSLNFPNWNGYGNFHDLYLYGN